jgi:hypothetical protein
MNSRQRADAIMDASQFANWRDDSRMVEVRNCVAKEIVHVVAEVCETMVLSIEDRSVSYVEKNQAIEIETILKMHSWIKECANSIRNEVEGRYSHWGRNEMS